MSGAPGDTCPATIEVDGYGTLHCNRERVPSVRRGGGPGLGPHKTHMADASPLAHPNWPPNWFQWVNSQDVGPILTRQGRQRELCAVCGKPLEGGSHSPRFLPDGQPDTDSSIHRFQPEGAL